METEKLGQKLMQIGYNRDVEIEEETWQNAMTGEHESSRSLAAFEHRNEPTFRDGETRKSIELKDYRDRKMDGRLVAELEHFNPEHRPLLHLFVDFPLWLWKNRIKNWGPRTED